MQKCSICKENYAVVFVTRIIEGKQSQQGLCLSCAKKHGIAPLNNLIGSMGMTDEDVDNLTKNMGEIFENLDGKELSDADLDAFSSDERLRGAGLTDIFNRLLSKDNIGLLGGGRKSDGVADAAGNASSSDNTRGSDNKDSKNSSKTRTQEKKATKKKKFLDAFGSNLTECAKEGRIDRVVGRQKEVDRIIQILNRRTKNNPILIGEPGVGKTAIAEGLAVRIVKKNVPAKLFNYEIYRIDMTGVIAGTQFRGQFESRMKGIIEEARNFENVILVIDEIHNLMGAGEADGAMNAANILKPALAKGDIQVIGATTLKEYRKYIEKDAALERRFQPVIVDEPSIEDSIEIVKGIKDYYEDYHKVSIPDDIVEMAVRMSERYITDRFLPDKAIDVIDEAGSRSNLKNTGLVELEILKEELRKVQEEKDYAVSVDSIEDYQKAADLKVHECRLLDSIRQIEDKCIGLEVTAEDVADVIESWTKIPVQKLTARETDKLLALEDRIHERIIGQDEAVTEVCRAIRRSRSGFKKMKKPASFIFVGPTGVGKTELVKALAVELFDNEGALIRLDMSEYMEKHTVSKLIGAPPGYIGYDEAGQLTEKVRRKPYSIILLDEIEKAHPDVFNMLLQILDDGRLTDSQGRIINFENTVVIMTSNAGTSLKAANIGFGGESYDNISSRVKTVLKETFKPEFINRVDSVVVFKELTNEELEAIVWLMLEEVRTEARENEVEIDFDKHIPELIMSKNNNKKLGARPFRREIQNLLEDELSELFIKGEIKCGDRLFAGVEDGKIRIKNVEPLPEEEQEAVAVMAKTSSSF
ncbi:MAG: AAA family ATPase [Oscillospiraceae bacterium]|nr:AAA family ATPase [Oscillospiraceae bacterium]